MASAKELQSLLKEGKMPKINPRRVGLSTVCDGQVYQHMDGTYYFVSVDAMRKYIGNAQHVVCFGKPKDYKKYKTFTGLVKFLNKKFGSNL